MDCNRASLPTRNCVSGIGRTYIRHLSIGSQVINELFHGGKITNAQCTRIENRPGAQNAINYIQSHYGLHDNIPHVCLNVADGVCLRGPSTSRFSPQNVATTLNMVLSMIDEYIWTEDDISIITPYREQAAIYRKVFRSQSLFRIQVFVYYISSLLYLFSSYYFTNAVRNECHFDKLKFTATSSGVYICYIFYRRHASATGKRWVHIVDLSCLLFCQDLVLASSISFYTSRCCTRCSC